MPNRQPTHVDAVCYVQVEPRWARYGSPDAAGNPILESAAAVRLTQTRPEHPLRGVVVTKLTLRIPASAFLPLAPEAIVVIPEGMAEPIVVEAIDPHEHEDDS